MEAMVSLSEFFSDAYTIFLTFVNFFLLELFFHVQFVTTWIKTSTKEIGATSQYLNLIEEIIPAIPYTGEKFRQESGECSVCLSEFREGKSVRKLKCNHIFHKGCVDKWLQQYYATCPLCRSKILPDNFVANYKILQNQRQYSYGREETFLLPSIVHGNTFYGFF